MDEARFCGGGFDKFRHWYDAGGALGIEAEMFFSKRWFRQAQPPYDNGA